MSHLSMVEANTGSAQQKPRRGGRNMGKMRLPFVRAAPPLYNAFARRIHVRQNGMRSTFSQTDAGAKFAMDTVIEAQYFGPAAGPRPLKRGRQGQAAQPVRSESAPPEGQQLSECRCFATAIFQ
jgi:hypothetical protein